MNIKNIHYVKALDAFRSHSKLTKRELMSWWGISETFKVEDLLKFLLKEGMIEESHKDSMINKVGYKKYYERK